MKLFFICPRCHKFHLIPSRLCYNKQCEFFYGYENVEFSFFTRKYSILVFKDGRTGIFGRGVDRYNEPLLAVLPIKVDRKITEEKLGKYLMLV
jgi:hypothetical protein